MELKPRRKRHHGLQPGHVRRSRRRVLRPRIGGIRRGVEPQIRPTTDPLKVGRDHNTRKMGVAHHRSRGPSWDYSGGCRSASGMIDTRVSESAWHWHPGPSVRTTSRAYQPAELVLGGTAAKDLVLRCVPANRQAEAAHPTVTKVPHTDLREPVRGRSAQHSASCISRFRSASEGSRKEAER